MTPSLPEAPLRRARWAASTELAERADPDVVAWLHEHPVLWLRGLQQIKTALQQRIARDGQLKTALNAEGRTGEAIEVERGRRRRKDRLNTTMARIDEVTSLCGAMPFGTAIAGDAVRVLAQIIELLDDDDVTAARSYAVHYADRWTQQKAG